MAASRTVYLTVRIDLYNPNINEITDDDVEKVISEIDYEFKKYQDYEVETEICGRNDEDN